MQRPQPPVNDEDLCFRSAGEIAELIRSRAVQSSTSHPGLIVVRNSDSHDDQHPARG